MLEAETGKEGPLLRASPEMATGLLVSLRGLSGLLLLLCALPWTEGGKVLVIPWEGSHWLSMKNIVRELHARGHETVVLAPDVSTFIQEEDFVTLQSYTVPYTKEDFEQNSLGYFKMFLEIEYSVMMFLSNMELMTNISMFYLRVCGSLLHNKDLMQHLNSSSYEVVLTDPVYPCGAVLAKMLNIPTVFLLRFIPSDIEFESAQAPSPPSYVPRAFTRNSDHMTFLERVKNIVYNLPYKIIFHVAYIRYENLASELLQRKVSFMEILSHASIWLFRLDFVFEYPRPIMPNMFFVGGLNCAFRKPLSQVCIEPLSKSAPPILVSLCPFSELLIACSSFQQLCWVKSLRRPPSMSQDLSVQ